jgi:hypothetical protein
MNETNRRPIPIARPACPDCLGIAASTVSSHLIDLLAVKYRHLHEILHLLRVTEKNTASRLGARHDTSTNKARMREI